MLDNRLNNTQSTPARRVLRFFGFDSDRNKESQAARNRPPKEPEERKQQFAIWYIFAAFLGVMLIQYLWLQYTQVETIPYSQFEQLLDENKDLQGARPVETISKARLRSRFLMDESCSPRPCRS